MTVKITNLIKLYTLILLRSGPKHGYELIKTLEIRMEKKISASHIYPFLEKLRKEKLIKYVEIEEREKKVYYLTKEGRKFVDQMLEKFGEIIHHTIEKKIIKCAHCGCEVYKGIHKEKIKGKWLKFCCEHCAKAYKKS